MKVQCLWYALDKWRSEGGYLVFRRSTHWNIPHVLHMSDDRKTLTHYVPPKDLKYPWLSVFGFNGKVIFDDPSNAVPMSPIGMLWGTSLLFILGGIWAARYYLNKLKTSLGFKNHANYN